MEFEGLKFYMKYELTGLWIDLKNQYFSPYYTSGKPMANGEQKNS